MYPDLFLTSAGAGSGETAPLPGPASPHLLADGPGHAACDSHFEDEIRAGAGAAGCASPVAIYVGKDADESDAIEAITEREERTAARRKKRRHRGYRGRRSKEQMAGGHERRHRGHHERRSRGPRAAWRFRREPSRWTSESAAKAVALACSAAVAWQGIHVRQMWPSPPRRRRCWVAQTT